MRILHTADWHLGRLFHGVPLTDDQSYTLEDLCRLVKDEKPDVLIIAGDIYDRSTPPRDAVSLLNETLTTVVAELKTRVLMIAGNHDDAERLEFGASLLAPQGLHIRGRFSEKLDPITLKDAAGDVDFCLIPYLQGHPPTVRSELNLASPEIQTFDDAMVDASHRAASASHAARRVAVAHCFATGGDVSESERPLNVGGSDQVSLNAFTDFNYTALGHLHRPQRLNDRVAYSGSLLKYSFSESTHKKSVSLIDLDGSGDISVNHIPLRVKRDVRIVEGSLSDILTTKDSLCREDFILARLSDTGALHEPLARIREQYPNIMQIERPALFSQFNAKAETTRATLKRTDSDMFSTFYKSVSGEELPLEMQHLFETTIDTASTDIE